jgi:hypothetical protein
MLAYMSIFWDFAATSPGSVGATGLVSGSLLILYPGIEPPAGYRLLGTMDLQLKSPNSKIPVSVYIKQ